MSSKTTAQQLFIEHQWKAGDIARLLFIEEQKINEWIHREGWAKKKEVARTSTQNILTLQQRAFEKFLFAYEDSSDWEILLKGIEQFTKSIEKAKEGGVTPATAQKVMIDFAKHMSSALKKDQQINFQNLLDFQDEFLKLNYAI